MRTDHAATTPVRKHHKLLSTMSQRNDHEYCPLLRKRHSQKQMANRERERVKYEEVQGRNGLVTLNIQYWRCLGLFRAARGSSQIVCVGLDVCCPSLFSKTALPTFMKLYIMLSYVLVWKPIEFGVNWSMVIKLIMIKT